MRLEGWESRLNQAIEEARHLPFQWGSHDCVTWTAHCVQVISGTDYLADIRRPYKSKTGAYRLIKSIAPTLADCVDLYLTRIPVAQAKRGDVVMHSSGALGVCFGVNSLFITEEQGLAGDSTLSCPNAWSVP